jgi:hypothetical protein
VIELLYEQERADKLGGLESLNHEILDKQLGFSRYFAAQMVAALEGELNRVHGREAVT